jgi:hypothetical protein
MCKKKDSLAFPSMQSWDCSCGEAKGRTDSPHPITRLWDCSCARRECADAAGVAGPAVPSALESASTAVGKLPAGRCVATRCVALAARCLFWLGRRDQREEGRLPLRSLDACHVLRAELQQARQHRHHAAPRRQLAGLKAAQDAALHLQRAPCMAKTRSQFVLYSRFRIRRLGLVWLCCAGSALHLHHAPFMAQRRSRGSHLVSLLAAVCCMAHAASHNGNQGDKGTLHLDAIWL